MGLHYDLYVLIERHQKTQKTLHGELAEFLAQHLGYAGLADAQQIGHLDLFQTLLLDDPVDSEHKLRLDQMFFRIGTPISWNTLPLPVSYPFPLIAPSPLQSVRLRAATGLDSPV